MRRTFTDQDLQPLEAMELSWRFAPSHSVMPDSVRSSLRALRPEAAARLHQQAAEWCGHRADAARTFSAADDRESVRQELRSLDVDPEEGVLVSWDSANALLMTWGTFCDWWDDFCYPSSDDVTIRSLAGSWVLCYDHEEQFRFRSASR